jgi:hypothetical protein
MKAARIHKFGGPEVIVLEDVAHRCQRLGTYHDRSQALRLSHLEAAAAPVVAFT